MKRLLVIGAVLAVASAATWALWPSGSDSDDSPSPAASSDRPGSQASPSAPTAPPPVPVERGLTGKVLDSLGNPVAGAEVQLAAEGSATLADEACQAPGCHKKVLDCGTPASAHQIAEAVSRREGEWAPEKSTRSAADGTFSFPEIRGGAFTLLALSPGLAPGVKREARAGYPAELVLTPARSASGKVVDERGRPIAGALVTAVPTLLTRFSEVTSGPDGSFKLDGLGDGALFFTAAAPGYLPTGRAFSFPAAGITLPLSRPRAIEGSVLSRGKPAAGAQVRLYAYHFGRTATAGQDGSFRFEGLLPEEYTVAASQETRAASATVTAEQPLTRVVLNLEDGMRVRGRVSDEAGAPIPGASIAAYLGSRRLSDSRSDEQGRFSVEGVPAGGRIIASQEGYESSAAPVAENAELELVLHAQVMVTGTVLSSSGEPVPEVQILAHGASRGMATSDATGAFRLALREAGPVSLMAHHSTYGAGEISIEAPAKDVKLQLNALGTVKARLVDKSHQPIPGARATAFVESKAPRETFSSDAPSDAQGRLILAGLQQGSYRVRFMARGYQPAERSEVAVPETGEVDLGEVTLENGLEISGVVLKSDGSPASGAFVHARGKGVKGSEGVSTDPDGSFTILGLREGSYQLSAFVDKSAAEVQAKAGDRGVTIRLPAASRLRGRVVEGDGRPITRFEIDGEPYEAADGRFDVPARSFRGHVFFRASAPGRVTVFEHAAMAENGDADAGDVVLGASRAVEGRVIDDLGNPIAGAVVSAGHRGEAAEPFSPQHAQDDGPTVSRADGRFRIEGLSPGPVSLQARRGALVAEETVYLTDADDLKGVELVLKSKGAIEGVVRGVDGKPAQAQVGVRGASTQTDAQGRFRLDGLSPGPATLLVLLEPDAGRVVTRSVEVKGGEVVKVTIDLAGGGILSVQVPGATEGIVHLVREDGVEPTGLAALQSAPLENGLATFGGLPAGQYGVMFYGAGPAGELKASGSAEVRDGQKSGLTLKAEKQDEPTDQAMQVEP